MDSFLLVYNIGDRMISVFNVQLSDPDILDKFNKWKSENTIFEKLYREPYLDLSNSYDGIWEIRQYDYRAIFSCFGDGFIICEDNNNIKFMSSSLDFASYIDKEGLLESNNLSLYNFDEIPYLDGDEKMESDDLINIIESLREDNKKLQEENDSLRKKLAFFEDDLK